MPASRIDFRNMLQEVVGDDVKLYYQPPSDLSGAGQVVIKNITYPCIIYQKSDYNVTSADNTNYIVGKTYTVTLITEDPDSELPDKVMMIPTAKYNRHYMSDGLYHDVYIINY